ncbi:MAG: 30S ribosomal protein S12 methylthiotransferase RimO [Oscillospiraceae bacterium]|jgi:ribosomal protein S12 methylthiotransferase|nr:30S ribosomal protein S12 methylthiotransferase RimO [Oscillospiraceae bacterium]
MQNETGRAARRETVGIVSLGCAKNQVNAEQMMYLLRNAGYTVTTDLMSCEGIVINTCGFVESAKTEAIETILEFSALKQQGGTLRRIVVTGCLAERYRSELAKEIPEIDAILGTANYQDVVTALNRAFFEDDRKDTVADEYFDAPRNLADDVPRVLSTNQGWAYIKIAEGCDNHCAFCTIPQLRGGYRSRLMESILAEAAEYSSHGVKELVLIAQDLTRYGRDRYGRQTLPDLLTQLCKIEGIEWIRLMYLYPDDVTDALIEVIAKQSKIVKYLDIPIQHIDDRVLARMNRRGNSERLRTLIRTLRERIPGVVLRSTLITGLPGEGEAEFERLCEFLREARPERVGVFVYSPEEGTPAYEMEDRAHFELAEHRAQLVTEFQDRLMDEYSESRVGSVTEVLIESFDEIGECWYGRSYAEAPEVDGKVFILGKKSLNLTGQFIRVRITAVLDGDLVGVITDSD